MKNLSAASTSIATSLAALLLVTGSAPAEFGLVTDFDDLVPGPIDDQDGWVAQHDTSVVTADPVDPDNQVLAVTTDSTYLFRETTIPDGTVRMFFFRFRLGSQQNFSVGLADSTNPTQFGDFEVEIGMSASTNELRINDDGMYDVLTELDNDTWYNCWLLVNNAGEMTDVYLHTRDGEDATPADQLDSDGQTSFVFRTGGAGTLIRYFIKTGGGSGPSGPLYLDDLYLEDTDALNLSNPATPSIPADINGDGVVDTLDLLALLADWGPCPPPPADCPADLNADGVVDVLDLLILLGNWT